MKSIKSLSAAAQGIIEELYENNAEARAIADALCDAGELKLHDWSRDAIEEARDWCNEVAREIEATADYKFRVDGQILPLRYCAADCEIYGWSSDLFGAVYCGDDFDDKASELIDRIMTDYDNRGVFCEEVL